MPSRRNNSLWVSGPNDLAPMDSPDRDQRLEIDMRGQVDDRRARAAGRHRRGGRLPGRCRPSRFRHGRNRSPARRRARARYAARLPSPPCRRATRRSRHRPQRALPLARSASKCGIGSLATTNASRPLSAMPTARSCHPPATLTAWFTGSASKNSLAMMIDGPPGTSSSVSCQIRRHASRRDGLLLLRTAASGLISTKCSTAALRNAGAACAARMASLISVPRPGPSSTMRTFSGEPTCCQTATIQSPISSPNIWLISGAVMKSPSGAEWIAGDVIAVCRIGEAERHVLRRPASGRRRRCAGGSRSRAAETAPLMLAIAAARVNDQGDADADQEQRHRQQHPHRHAAPQKAELGVRLAEKFAGRARQRIYRGEGAEDEAGPLQRAACGP